MSIAAHYKSRSLAYNTVLAALFYWVAYYTWEYFLHSVNELIEAIYIAAFIAMFILTITWFRPAMAVYRENDSSGAGLGIIAVFLMSLVLVQSRLYGYLNLALGRPEWLRDNPYVGFIAYQVAVVGILWIFATRNTPRGESIGYRKFLFVAGLISAFVSGYLAATLGPVPRLGQ